MTDQQTPPPPPQNSESANLADDARQRPWWRRKRILIPAGLLVVIIVGVATNSGNENDTDQSATTVTEPEPEPAPDATGEPDQSATTTQPPSTTTEPEPNGDDESDSEQPAPTTTAAPTTTTEPVDPSCHPAYEPCLPFLPGDALNCSDLTDDQQPVIVIDLEVDPYNLDSDNDGIGCASDDSDQSAAAPDEAADFVGCTRLADDLFDYFALEVVNQSSKTSTYWLDVVFYDSSGARVADSSLNLISHVRPNERAIETSIASFDAEWETCDMLDLDRFAAESDPSEMAEVTCEITGEDFVGDVEATATATNSSSEDSDYDITVAFVNSDQVRIGTSSAYITRVRPGETAPSDIFTTSEYADDLVCEVVGVERTASR